MNKRINIIDSDSARMEEIDEAIKISLGLIKV